MGIDAKQIEQLERYGKERDEAFLSLDEDRITAFLKKWNQAIPENKKVFWAGVYKTIIYLKMATIEQKRDAVKWLKENGLTPYLDWRKAAKEGVNQ